VNATLSTAWVLALALDASRSPRWGVLLLDETPEKGAVAGDPAVRNELEAPSKPLERLTTPRVSSATRASDFFSGLRYEQERSLTVLPLDDRSLASFPQGRFERAPRSVQRMRTAAFAGC